MPGNPGAFDLTRKLHVVFRPVTVRATEQEAAGGLKLLQSNIAGALPSALWQQLPLVSLLWCVRWTKKGIQPVAPRVVLAHPVTLPPGQSCVFSG